jgi:hypothetical protein
VRRGVGGEVELDAEGAAQRVGVAAALGGLVGGEGLQAQLGEPGVAGDQAQAGGDATGQAAAPGDRADAEAADDLHGVRPPQREAEQVVDEREVTAPAALALDLGALAGDAGAGDLVEHAGVDAQVAGEHAAAGVRVGLALVGAGAAQLVERPPQARSPAIAAADRQLGRVDVDIDAPVVARQLGEDAPEPRAPARRRQVGAQQRHAGALAGRRAGQRGGQGRGPGRADRVDLALDRLEGGGCGLVDRGGAIVAGRELEQGAGQGRAAALRRLGAGDPQDQRRGVELEAAADQQLGRGVARGGPQRPGSHHRAALAVRVGEGREHHDRAQLVRRQRGRREREADAHVLARVAGHDRLRQHVDRLRRGPAVAGPTREQVDRVPPQQEGPTPAQRRGDRGRGARVGAAHRRHHRRGQRQVGGARHRGLGARHRGRGARHRRVRVGDGGLDGGCPFGQHRRGLLVGPGGGARQVHALGLGRRPGAAVHGGGLVGPGDRPRAGVLGDVDVVLDLLGLREVDVDLGGVLERALADHGGEHDECPVDVLDRGDRLRSAGGRDLAAAAGGQLGGEGLADRVGEGRGRAVRDGPGGRAAAGLGRVAGLADLTRDGAALAIGLASQRLVDRGVGAGGAAEQARPRRAAAARREAGLGGEALEQARAQHQAHAVGGRLRGDAIEEADPGRRGRGVLVVTCPSGQVALGGAGGDAVPRADLAGHVGQRGLGGALAAAEVHGLAAERPAGEVVEALEHHAGARGLERVVDADLDVAAAGVGRPKDLPAQAQRLARRDHVQHRERGALHPRVLLRVEHARRHRPRDRAVGVGRAERLAQPLQRLDGGHAQREARRPRQLRDQEARQPGPTQRRAGQRLARQRRRGRATDEAERQLELGLDRRELAGDALAQRVEVEVAGEGPEVAATAARGPDLAADDAGQRLALLGRGGRGVHLGLDLGDAGEGRRVLVLQLADRRGDGHDQAGEPGLGRAGGQARGQGRDRRPAQPRDQRIQLSTEHRCD